MVLNMLLLDIVNVVSITNETNESVNKKLIQAVRHEIIPIVCVGESLEIRENGTTKCIC